MKNLATIAPLILSLTVLGVACGDKKSEEKPAAKPAQTDPKPATDKPATTEPAPKPAPAAVPKEWAKIEGLGVQAEMPQGAKVEFDTKAKRAHLRAGDLKVNVSVVDEFSGSFEKLTEKKKNLIKMIKSEKTDAGWVVIKHVNSEIFKKPMFEANVRTSPAGSELSCGASAETEELINQVVAACQSLKSL